MSENFNNLKRFFKIIFLNKKLRIEKKISLKKKIYNFSLAPFQNPGRLP